jgi:hypothetical protein
VSNSRSKKKESVRVKLEIQCFELEDEILKMKDLLETSKKIKREKSQSVGKKRGKSKSKKKQPQG